MGAMLGGRRWCALLAVVVLVALLPGSASALGQPENLSIVVLGDSYSSGNGAGSYTGTPECRRSSANYARRFEQLVEAGPTHAPTTVNTVACSGAVTADITRARGGQPAQVDAVTSNVDAVFLTIGGNDAGFSSIVGSCLLVVTRDAGRCETALATAERMVADGTLAARLTTALTAIRAHADRLTRIVLVGYPYLEGDPYYIVPATTPGTPAVAAGARVRALSDAGARAGEQVVTALNAAQGTTTNVFVPTTGAFAGHELYATQLNPSRWSVAPFTDAGLGDLDLWYHPNAAGHAAIAQALYDDARVPKADVRS